MLIYYEIVCYYLEESCFGCFLCYLFGLLFGVWNGDGEKFFFCLFDLLVGVVFYLFWKLLGINGFRLVILGLCVVWKYFCVVLFFGEFGYLENFVYVEV